MAVELPLRRGQLPQLRGAVRRTAPTREEDDTKLDGAFIKKHISILLRHRLCGVNFAVTSNAMCRWQGSLPCSKVCDQVEFHPLRMPRHVLATHISRFDHRLAAPVWTESQEYYTKSQGEAGAGACPLWFLNPLEESRENPDGTGGKHSLSRSCLPCAILLTGFRPMMRSKRLDVICRSWMIRRERIT